MKKETPSDIFLRFYFFLIFHNITIQEKTASNKIMNNNIKHDASQLEVLYKTQINITKSSDIVLRKVTNRLTS